MVPVKTGSLCSGYMGLEAAVAAVLDGEPVWVADNDDDVAALLAYRYPGLRNLGDLKTIKWDEIPAVEILTGGYPCQPFSQAGRRLGDDDPRHLWPDIAGGLGRLRPRLAVFENVAGHLSLGFDVVLADLHAAGYDVWWVLVRASDVGAPHGRARVFLLAVRRDGPARVPGRFPLAVLEDGDWLRPQESLFGPVGFGRQFPPAGAMIEGRVYPAEPPSPYRPAGLLPTPDAGTFGDKPETVLARRAREVAKARNGNGFGLTLAMTAALLPTPTLGDSRNSRNTTSARADGSKHHDGTTLADAASLLPTPDGYAGSRGGSQEPGKRQDGGHQISLADVTEQGLLPSPAARDHKSGRSNLLGTNARPLNEIVEMGVSAGQAGGVGDLSSFGARNWSWVVESGGFVRDYTAAVYRWEDLTRDCPPPVVATRGGALRLNPELSEWMMGLPLGWVTGVPGLTRTAKLRIAGNGVVPAQAVYALSLLVAAAGLAF